MKVETLGIRLRRAREIKRLSQKQVKEITGISNVNLSRYELDQTKPGIATIKKLAELYEVSVDWIFGETDKPDIIVSIQAEEISIEWITVIKKCKASGITPEHINSFIDIVNRK